MPLRAWFLYLAVGIVTVVLVLQHTKQAMLPATQTPVLWAAEIAMIASVFVLRSGWGRDSGWASEQERLGTLANNFYEPRRQALSEGFTVGGGVLGALWWAAATWSVVLFGMRRKVATRGLLDFEIAALVGALVGGVIGAVIGLVVGHFWEKRHRRRRMERMHA
jgi:tetrahydromethanopterin S-methyltransferase subunit C